MRAIHRITPDCQPVFPCWLWDSPECIWSRSKGSFLTAQGIINLGYTHWHPDQPAAPAATPGITTERDVRNTVTPGAHNGFPPIPLHDGEGSQVQPAPATPWLDRFADQSAQPGMVTVSAEGAAPAQGETPESEAAQREFESGHGYPLAVHVEFAKKQEREITTLRAQLAVVEKQRDGWMEDARIRACNTDHANNKLAAAEAELAALRLDRERLDWLFDRGLCWRDCDKDNPNWIVGPGTEWLYKVHNGRAAIDAARQQEGGK